MMFDFDLGLWVLVGCSMAVGALAVGIAWAWKSR